MSVTAIIQARMTSTRLPGKVLLEAAGKPMLQHEIERVGRARKIDRIVIATTTNQSDNPIAELADRLGVGLYRGPENDVLTRFAGAAAADGAETIVRLTGDCPLLDPVLVDQVIELLEYNRPMPDYATNSFPRTWPIGLDVEVMRAEALAVAADEATDDYDHEHVTPFIYRQPQRFRLANLVSPRNLSGHRWTLDTPADYQLLKQILEALLPRRPDFGLDDILTLLAEHPDWSAINASVPQKQRLWETEAAAGARPGDQDAGNSPPDHQRRGDIYG